MEAVKEFFSRVMEFLTPMREELAISFLTFSFSILTYLIVKRKINKKTPDQIGMRVIEELAGQTLIKVRNPGNLREISRIMPSSQNVLIRFARMESKEFEYAIELLKELGQMRGVPIVKVDQGLFLLRGAQDTNSSSDSKYLEARIVDFQGREVAPN